MSYAQNRTSAVLICVLAGLDEVGTALFLSAPKVQEALERGDGLQFWEQCVQRSDSFDWVERRHKVVLPRGGFSDLKTPSGKLMVLMSIRKE